MDYSHLKSFLENREVTLVAVSKTKPVEKIMSLYDQGQRIFGENRVQEMATKYAACPEDIVWHMIGHLQRNKVKVIAPFVSMIHSVDGLELAGVINKLAAKHERTIDILLQLKIASEFTKSGYEKETLLAEMNELLSMENVRVRGMMGMASFTDDNDVVSQEFTYLKDTFDTIKQTYFSDTDSFDTLSMGMSGDYQLAIDHGSTMVRIGSLLFGSR